MDTSNFRVYTDGGSRGNPGPAAYGFVIYSPNGAIVAEGSGYLGATTNNQAEYQGIVAALRKVAELQIQSPVTCYLDSQLVVRQVNGEYKMKNEALKPWLDEVYRLRQQIGVPVQFIDVRREENKYADGLVNQVLDQVAKGTVNA